MLAAYTVGGAVSWNLASVGAAASAVADHYGLPLASVGVFAMVMFAGQLLLQVPGGRLVDRVGVRNAGALALAIIGACNLLLLLGGGIATALVLRAAIGAAVGLGFVAGAAGVRAAEGSSLDQGIYGGIALGVGGIGIAVVGSLATQLGWTAPFITGAAVAGVGLVVLLATSSPSRKTTAATVSLADVLTDRRLLPFAALNTATFGLSVVVGNWAVPLLVRHGNQRSAAWVGSLTLLGALLGRPVAGWLTTRQPQLTRPIVVSSILLGATGMLLLTAGQPDWAALVGSLLVGLCAGVPFGPVYNAATIIRTDAPGLAVAIMNIPSIAFIVVGTPLVGWTFELPGEGRLGFVALAALWAVTALVVPRSWPHAAAGARF